MVSSAGAGGRPAVKHSRGLLPGRLLVVFGGPVQLRAGQQEQRQVEPHGRSQFGYVGRVRRPGRFPRRGPGPGAGDAGHRHAFDVQERRQPRLPAAGARRLRVRAQVRHVFFPPKHDVHTMSSVRFFFE